MTTAPVTIVEIEDTRSRDDDGRIVPDSGDVRPCDHCGRPHAVHYVLSDGRRVGSTCAAKIGITSRSPRYILRHTPDLLSPAHTDRDEWRDIDAGWSRSLALWAALNPRGVVEVIDRVTGRYRAVVAGGQVDTAAPWQHRE